MRLSYRWQATVVISLGLLMAVLDTTIVSVVLPQLAQAFHTDYQSATWVATGYFLANAAVIPIVGYFSDRMGSKKVFLIALGMFTLGSLLCAISSDLRFLTAARIFQGIGGGALLPVALAMIFRMFEPTERAGAVALLTIPLLLGPAFGPVLGGYLTTSFNWNAIFTINLPIGVIAFLLSIFILRNHEAEHMANDDEPPATGRFDVVGLVLSMGGFTIFVYAINQAGTYGWSDFNVLLFLAIGIVLLSACVVIELRVPDPVIDLQLFRSYTFTVGNILIWATTAILFGSIFLVPPFFEHVEGLSSLSTGVIMISQALAMGVGVALSGKLYNIVGPRLLSVIGAILVAVSMIGFIHLTTTTSGQDVQLWLIVRGLGLGLVGQPLQTLAVSVVSKQQMAKASSLMSSTKTLFGTLGMALLTTYLTQQTTTHVKDVTLICAQQAGRNTLLVKVCITQHAMTMGFNDTFMLSLIGCIICAVMAIFVGRDPALEAAKVAKKRGETVDQEPAVSTGD
jgi:EmrB/QacA subfamily drug resistance transporter